MKALAFRNRQPLAALGDPLSSHLAGAAVTENAVFAVWRFGGQ